MYTHPTTAIIQGNEIKGKKKLEKKKKKLKLCPVTDIINVKLEILRNLTKLQEN